MVTVDEALMPYASSARIVCEPWNGHWNTSLILALCDPIYRLCLFSAHAFSALTLLVGRQEEHPAHKNWVMGYWHGYLSGAWYKWFACGPAEALPPVTSCFSKIQNGLPFWCQLTQVVLEKRPLNLCVCVCVFSASIVCEPWSGRWNTSVIRTRHMSRTRPIN